MVYQKNYDPYPKGYAPTRDPRRPGLRPGKALLSLLILLSLLSASFLVSSADGAGVWKRLTLKRGQTNGYAWTAGVLVPTHSSRTQFCVQLGLVESEESDGISLGHESTECGSLGGVTDSVTGSVSAGSGRARITVIERLYDPFVRSLTVEFGNGSKKDFRLPLLRGSSLHSSGAARFRYFVFPALAKASTCIRNVTTYDAESNVIRREPGQGCLGKAEKHRR